MVHPLRVYNVIETNSKVHIYDAWCGSGKTRAMLEFLACTSTNTLTRAVIAFPTIRLALEAEVFMRESLRYGGMSNENCKKHFQRNIATLYDLKEAHIEEIRSLFDVAPNGNTRDLLESVLHLAGNRLHSLNNGTRIDERCSTDHGWRTVTD